jgi:hypothetical protein
MLQDERGKTEFVQTVGSSLEPESVKQGAIIKIVEKPPGGGADNLSFRSEKRMQTLGRMKPRA